ncbi:hypothetical protein ACF8PD_13780 [Vibrio plantisponsor]|uniref:hypothetical protein n=1 Tax=Vibrio plantisponsor TaxID=664643 RepID=UPI003709C934
MKVKVEAKAFQDRIEITQNFEDPYLSGDPMVNMHREILRLRDAAVRDALISLGWTPPDESSKQPIEEHQNFEAFIRAFWRRIEPYKNDHGKELPKEMPSEFIWAMGTAGILLRDKVDDIRLKPTSELKPEQFFIGSKIIAFNGYFFECEWDGDHWCSIGGDDFDWWMQYPKIPEKAGTDSDY